MHFKFEPRPIKIWYKEVLFTTNVTFTGVSINFKKLKFDIFEFFYSCDVTVYAQEYVDVCKVAFMYKLIYDFCH